MSKELFDLQGKVALVTGASKGLGKYISQALSQAGADIALCARSIDELNEVKAGIEQKGGKAEAFVIDVLDEKSVQAKVEEIIKAFGHIDILVNNAGVNIRKTVLELTSEEWDLVLNTNLKGYFLMAKQVLPYMLERGSGKIINMASIFGSVALPNQGPYASSKGGIIQLTKVLALEMAQKGIQVNAIAPTYFETPLVAQLRNDPDRYNFICERTPMGRWGQPEEISGAAIFLASKASNFITGQTLFVDGGWTAW